jgi:hypothetical protein
LNGFTLTGFKSAPLAAPFSNRAWMKFSSTFSAIVYKPA